MTRQILFRLKEPFDQNLNEVLIEWLVRDNPAGWATDEAYVAGNHLKGEGRPELLGQWIEDSGNEYEVIFLAPVEECFLTSVDIPQKNRRKVLKAVPYLVEEDLACDIENCHFVTALNELSPETGLVAAMSHERLRAWLGRFSGAGVVCDHVKIDALQIPFEGTPVILCDSDRCVLRLAEHQAMAVETGLLSDLLKLAGPLDGVEVYTTGTSDITDHLKSILPEDKPVNVHVLEARAVDFLAQHYTPEALELLQGEYKPGRKKRKTSRNPWKKVAYGALAVFFLQILTFLGQGYYLNIQASGYEESAAQLYASVFPHDKNVRDIRRMWRGHLGSGGPSEGFTKLLSQAAVKLASRGLKLEKIDYNENRGDLTLRLRGSKIEDFVSLSQELENEGIASRIGSTSQSDGAVTGSLNIEIKR